MQEEISRLDQQPFRLCSKKKRPHVSMEALEISGID